MRLATDSAGPQRTEPGETEPHQTICDISQWALTVASAVDCNTALRCAALRCTTMHDNASVGGFTGRGQQGAASMGATEGQSRGWLALPACLAFACVACLARGKKKGKIWGLVLGLLPNEAGCSPCGKLWALSHSGASVCAGVEGGLGGCRGQDRWTVRANRIEYNRPRQV